MEVRICGGQITLVTRLNGWHTPFPPKRDLFVPRELFLGHLDTSGPALRYFPPPPVGGGSDGGRPVISDDLEVARRLAGDLRDQQIWKYCRISIENGRFSKWLGWSGHNEIPPRLRELTIQIVACCGADAARNAIMALPGSMEALGLAPERVYEILTFLLEKSRSHLAQAYQNLPVDLAILAQWQAGSDEKVQLFLQIVQTESQPLNRSFRLFCEVLRRQGERAHQQVVSLLTIGQRYVEPTRRVFQLLAEVFEKLANEGPSRYQDPESLLKTLVEPTFLQMSIFIQNNSEPAAVEETIRRSVQNVHLMMLSSTLPFLSCLVEATQNISFGNPYQISLLRGLAVRISLMMDGVAQGPFRTTIHN